MKMNMNRLSWGCGLYVNKNGETRDPFVLEKREAAPQRTRRRIKKRVRMKLALATPR